MKKLLFLLGTALLISAISLKAQNNQSLIVLDSLAANGVRIIEYTPKDVCAKRIHIEINSKGTIDNVVFTHGCDGNVKGIGALIKGMEIQEAINRLKGIPCGKKKTSCPDQLANALIEIQKKAVKR